jgi:MFS family permease
MNTIQFTRGRPLLTALFYVMVGIFPLYLTSSQVIALDQELGFGVATLGFATGLHFGLAAVFAQPISAVVARVGAPRGLQVGAALAGMASVVALSAGTWWPILVVTSLGGLANGFMQVSTNVFLARDAVFRRQGVSFGAKQGAIPLANAVAGALLPVVGVALGWRWPFVIAAGVAVLAIFAAPPLENPLVTAEGRNAEPKLQISSALKWLAVGGFCGGAAGNALSLFVVPSAVDQGVSQAAAGVFLASSAGLVFLVRVSTGWLADRNRSSGQPEMISLLAIGAVGCAVLATATSTGTYLASMPLAMIGSWGWPALAYFTVVRIHPEAPARASGVVLTGNLTGTVIGPLIVGVLANQGLFAGAWAMCAGLSAVGATAMYFSLRAFRAGSTRSAGKGQMTTLDPT